MASVTIVCPEKWGPKEIVSVLTGDNAKVTLTGTACTGALGKASKIWTSTFENPAHRDKFEKIHAAAKNEKGDYVVAHGNSSASVRCVGESAKVRAPPPAPQNAAAPTARAPAAPKGDRIVVKGMKDTDPAAIAGVLGKPVVKVVKECKGGVVIVQMSADDAASVAGKKFAEGVTTEWPMARPSTTGSTESSGSTSG